MPAASRTFAYVGNWDIQKSPPKDAFGVFALHPGTGELTQIGSALPGVSVGITYIDEDRGVLYCVDETATNHELFDAGDVPLHARYLHGGGGRVFALKMDPLSGSLEEINHLPSFGSLPSYVTLDGSGDFLLVTHHTSQAPVTAIARGVDGQFEIDLRYDDATVVLFPLGPDGNILPPCDVYTHRAAPGALGRQTHPQLHSVVRAPSGHFFVVCDKGSDEVFTLTVDRAAGQLRVLATYRPLLGGSPRYSAFHPTLPVVYVNFETRAVVASFRYSDDGTLVQAALTSALPPDIQDHLDIKQSDLCIHPSGRTLYTLLRGTDAVSVFDIDNDGGIELVQTLPLEATGPRGCALSPDGRYLYIAMVTSDSVLVLSVDGHGRLSHTGGHADAPRAGSVAMFSTGTS